MRFRDLALVDTASAKSSNLIILMKIFLKKIAGCVQQQLHKDNEVQRLGTSGHCQCQVFEPHYLNENMCVKK